MKAMICEGCKRMATTIANGAVDGWISVRRHHDVIPDEDHDYCSSACAVIALTDHLTKQQKPLLARDA